METKITVLKPGESVEINIKDSIGVEISAGAVISMEKSKTDPDVMKVTNEDVDDVSIKVTTK